MKHPKPYIILVKYESNWTIRAEYETLSVAETHALNILREEHPYDLKIVKDLFMSLHATGENE